MSYRFGPFRLDPNSGRLSRGAVEIELQPKSMALLGAFLEQPDRLFSRDELLAEVWPDVVVSDHSLSQALFKLRQALQVVGDDTRWIQTVHGRGYRFAGTVTKDAPEPAMPRRDAFVGRREALAAIDTAWDDGALGVALVGPGGQGKTRLALEHLARPSRWPVGPVVDLVSARTVDDATTAVARALNVPLESGDAVAQLGRALRARGPMLWVLDNLESVRDGLTERIATWSAVAPEIRWLLTSRERTPLPGFVALELPGLSEDDGVALFHARAHDRSVRLDPRWDDDLRAIVAHLDGQPLAIELAVARVPLLDPGSLRARLERRTTSLGRLPSAPPRHQTLQATVQWSWGLLGKAEQHVLHALSLFRGPFTAALADAVTGRDVLDELTVLSDSFLVRPVIDLAGHLRLPVPIREVVGATPPDDAVVARFVTAMAAMARQPTTDWHDLPNLQAALALATPPAARVALASRVSRMLCGLARPREALSVLDGLPLDAVPPAARDQVMCLRAEAMPGLGSSAAMADELDAAADAAVARGDAEAASRLFTHLSVHAHLCQRHEQALGAGERAMALAEACGDLEAFVMGAYRVAVALLYRGEAQRAQAVARRGLAACRAHHPPRRRAPLLDLLGTLAAQDGRMEEALALRAEAAELVQESGEVHNGLTIRLNHASTLQEIGRFEEALALQQAHYEELRLQGRSDVFPHLLITRSVTLMHLDRLDEARMDLSEAAAGAHHGLLPVLVAVNRAAVSCLAGDDAATMRWADEALDASADLRVVEAATRLWRVLAQLGRGELSGARADLARVDALREGLPKMLLQAADVAQCAAGGGALDVPSDHHPLAHLVARGAERALRRATTSSGPG